MLRPPFPKERHKSEPLLSEAWLWHIAREIGSVILRRHLFLLGLVGSLGPFLACGCSSQVREDLEIGERHLGELARAYIFYANQHRGQGPPNKAALDKFLKANEKSLIMQGISNPEGMYVSPRDNEPYVVLWGLRIKTVVKGRSSQPIAYEKTGKDGKRWVAFADGIVNELDESEFEKVVPKKSR